MRSGDLHKCTLTKLNTLAIRAKYPGSHGLTQWEAAELCLKCGVCCTAEHSCHVMHDEAKFGPLYTFVYDCLGSPEGARNPNIWLCVSCHKCEEVCPYEVSPIKFIESLKAEATGLGVVHPTIRGEVGNVLATGFAFPLTSATERQRQALGLPALSTGPAVEVQAIAQGTGLFEKLREGRQ